MGNLATAYVQVIPSAQGMQGNLSKLFGKEMPSGGKSAGGLFGSGMVGAIKGVIATAGIGKALTETIMAGSEMQQLQGGVEKIFNDLDTSAIMNDAANAYKNLGMSANQYLATINDVGAAFASTMGDAKGYETAKTGLQAISDFASGTGKNVDVLSQKFAMITRSTSSYQSIADQFSGILPATSAGFLEQAQAAGFLSGNYKKLTEVPVAEYQQAVSQMLAKGTEELGLAGNTAAEAATTISGSFAAMKASFTNVLSNLTLGQDITPSLNALAQTTVTFLKGNLTPAVLNIVKALPGAACTFVKALLPGNIKGVVSTGITKLTQFITTSLPTVLASGTQIVNQLVTGFLTGLPGFLGAAGTLLSGLLTAIIGAFPALLSSGFSMVMNLVNGFLSAAPSFLTTIGTLLQSALQAIMQAGPSMLSSGVNLILNLVNGLVMSLPAISSAAMSVVSNLISTFAANFPAMLSSGVSLILNLASGLLASLPNVVSSATQIVTQMLSTFASHLPDLLAQGISLIGQLVAGIISMIPDIITSAGDIVKSVWDTISATDWLSLGADIIRGIVSGITSAASSLFSALKDLASQALQAAKDALEIKSPSRRARKEVGRMIPAGAALGVTDGIPLMKRAMKRMSDESMPSLALSLRAGNRPRTTRPEGVMSRVVNVNQYIYGQKQSASEMMQEARYQAEMAVLLGV